MRKLEENRRDSHDDQGWRQAAIGDAAAGDRGGAEGGHHRRVLPRQEGRRCSRCRRLHPGLLAAPSAGLCRQGGRHQGEGHRRGRLRRGQRPAVMGAWGKDQKTEDKVTMLADGSGDFARALGLELDLSKGGLGVRSKRYSMLVDNGVVKSLNLETQPGQVDYLSAREFPSNLFNDTSLVNSFNN